MVRVKLCGMTNPTDVTAAVNAGADAIGVITDLDAESPREVDIDTAHDLLAAVPPLVTSVVVTTVQDIDTVVELASRVHSDAIQLHGDYDGTTVEAVRDATERKVIAALDAGDLLDNANVAAAADALLIDSSDKHGHGGTGETHDWVRASNVVEVTGTPVILAGGLTPENVAEAIDTVGPYGVDVASGIESAPGEKSHDAMEQFVQNARDA